VPAKLDWESRRIFIVNFKNYRRIQGDNSLALAKEVENVASKYRVEIIVSPPTVMLAKVVSEVKVPVFSQSIGTELGEKTTGADLPEAIKAAGASGTLLNHSESRKPTSDLVSLVPRARGLGLRVCLCANGADEAASLAKLGSDYLAVEPPELIGTGIAVSKARPEVVRATVRATREAGFAGKVLCGAGIVSGEDAKAAVDLGSDGILVSSSVVEAPNWASKLDELARSLD
jgi:triosephosphate isomerase